MSLPSLFVATCNSQPWVYADYVWSVFGNLLNYGGKIAMYRSDYPRTRIRNNRAITDFLASGMDVMVKMDIDQEYPEDYFRIMAPLVAEYKVIGPEIYDRWRGNGYGILAFGDKEDLSSWIDCSDEVGIKAYPYTHTNNFYAREVLEAIEPPYYESAITPDGLNKANHTDYDFLDKIKAAGYQIYLNHSIEVNHLFLGRANNDMYNRYKGENRGFSRFTRSSR